VSTDTNLKITGKQEIYGLGKDKKKQNPHVTAFINAMN
jgi:hypothetical protein